jgi:glycosyltransferase involved in cell wall biosynthesis
LHEGLPIALLEAMSYCLPVIVSDIPANRHVDLPEDCYFPPDDEMAFSGLLEKKLKHKFLAITYDLEKYNWDTIAQETARIYNELVKR